MAPSPLAGDLLALAQALRERGVPEPDIEELEELLGQENARSGMGSSVVGWISRARKAVENGLWRRTTGDQIATAVLAYYGITIIC